MDMNVFTLLALKSKRIELLSSAWWHFEDFFFLFLMVIDFNVFFIVVWSQIRHKGETIFLSKMVMGSLLVFGGCGKGLWAKIFTLKLELG